MDPTELLKHAPELVKGGAAVAGALKITEVMKAILGPAASEIAERFRDEIRRYRYGRQLECLKKAERMAQDAGFTPKAVPIKLLFPLLENASFEENEDLHNMWAALLANAASPDKNDAVRPGFLPILKHLSHDEAVMLRWMLDQIPRKGGKLGPRILVSYTRIRSAYSELFGNVNALPDDESDGIDPRCRVCVSGLVGAGLIEKTEDSESGRWGFMFTWYGYEFVTACTAPKSKT